MFGVVGLFNFPLLMYCDWRELVCACCDEACTYEDVSSKILSKLSLAAATRSSFFTSALSSLTKCYSLRTTYGR